MPNHPTPSPNQQFHRDEEKAPLLPHASGRSRPSTQQFSPLKLSLALLLAAWVALCVYSRFVPHKADTPSSLHALVAGTNDSSKAPTFPDVEFDDVSLSLKGQRLFVQAGEFHPWRLPVTDLWRDVLQKMVAGGLNTVSIYTHWGLVNPSPGVFDWTGFRDLALFLDIAQEVGLWVIVRPGPYINAETTAGGIPGWVTTLEGTLRTNTTDYREAWEPYIRQVCQITRPYQMSKGGPVILMQVENELLQAYGQKEYFNAIAEVMRDEQIVVPLTFNDFKLQDFYASGDAKADLYGFDTYPQSFDCSKPYVWAPVNTNYSAYHKDVNPQQPLYIPEFQGGAFDPWGPAAPGYDKCRTLTGADFESVFYLDLWASNLKMVSFYMIHGGTNWGMLAFPGVYTSYDYGAAIAEARGLSEKFTELKRQSHFLKSVREFTNTELIEGSHSAIGLDPEVFISELRNRETNAGFYIVRQTNSSSQEHIEFDLEVKTAKGAVKLSSKKGSAIKLAGRQSKVISTDLTYGRGSKLLYTSAAILFAGKIGSRDILFLHANINDTTTTSLYQGASKSTSTGPASFTESSSPVKGGSTLSITTPIEGISALSLSPSHLVIYADSETAGTFWTPIITSPTAPYSNFYSYGSNETVLVGGPYLVRNASIHGTTLSLTGDLLATATTTLTVFAPDRIRTVKWNGVQVSLEPHDPLTAFGALVSHFHATIYESLKLPALTDWVYANSLPEIVPTFDDSKWAVVKDGPLNNPYPPFYGKKWLYSCEYGFCEGVTVWRGAFEGQSQTAVNLSLGGGEAFAGSVWLNDVYLGPTFGNSTNNLNIIATTNQTYEFPAGSLKEGNNIVTVLVDNMGQDEGDVQVKHPRGIQGYALLGPKETDFTSWKVQGKEGGNSAFPDKVRGITNEGGFYAERRGWHLPGFDDKSWEKRSPVKDGLQGAGVGIFRTTFDLDLPENMDIPISVLVEGLEVGGSDSTTYRSQIYVNGWQFGRFVSNLGPQSDFRIPEGILNYHATNTIAVILWALGKDGAKIDGLSLVVGGEDVYSGGVGPIASDNPSYSPRS